MADPAFGVDPGFQIHFSLKGRVMQTNLEESGSDILKQFDYFIRWYQMAGVSWWLFVLILISIHKS